MTTTSRIIKTLLIAALLSCGSVQAADNTIVIALEDGKQIATFKVADANCVLKDDQIRCTPATK